MNGTLWQWAMGMLVVVIYGAQRFDSPEHLRATTTFFRYFFAKLFYVASVIFLFVLIAGALTDPASVYLLLSGGTLPDGVAKDVQKLPGPLLSALFLTALLPSLPVLKTVDAWLKFQFQRFGNIPFEIRHLSRRLGASSFKAPPLLQHALEEQVGAWSDAELASTLRPNDVRTRMPRIASLVLTVRLWADAPRYGAYVEDHKSTEIEINRRYEQIRTALVDLWLAARNAGEPARSVVNAVERRLRDETAELEKMLLDFISGGVLQCARSKGSRAAAIRELGFAEVEEGRVPLRIDQIAGLAIAIFLSMAAVALLFAKWLGDQDFDRAFLIVLMVSMIYIVAIVVAVYPKSIWPEANVGPRGERPYFAYIVSGFVAAGLAFLIALTFKYIFILDFNFVASLHDSMKRWPWLVMSGGVAVVVAWAADGYVSDPLAAPRQIRIYEAIGVAIALVLLQWFVQELLESVAADNAQALREAERAARRLLTAACVGLVIGYSVPHACRVRLPRKTDAGMAGISERVQPT